MSMEASRFRLGLFFTLGTVLFVAMMIWLTGWFRNPDTRPYVCYFSESVQGLETGSSVRYRGVPVGTVERIAVAPDGRLVEISELRDHPFMVGSQFHPEFKSRPNGPHPLFRDLIGAAKRRAQEGQRISLPAARPVEMEG